HLPLCLAEPSRQRRGDSHERTGPAAFGEGFQSRGSFQFFRRAPRHPLPSRERERRSQTRTESLVEFTRIDLSLSSHHPAEGIPRSPPLDPAEESFRGKP